MPRRDSSSDPFEQIMANNDMEAALGSLLGQFQNETVEQLLRRYRQLPGISEDAYRQGELYVRFARSTVCLRPIVDTRFGQLCALTQEGAVGQRYYIVQGSYVPSWSCPVQTLTDDERQKILMSSSGMSVDSLPVAVWYGGVSLGVVAPRRVCGDSYLIVRNARPAIDFLRAIPEIQAPEETHPLKSGNFVRATAGDAPDSVFWLSDQPEIAKQLVIGARASIDGVTKEFFEKPTS